MEIFVVGVGDAFSTRHWGTSFLVREDDFVLAIDCGDSYLRALSEHAWPHAGAVFGPDNIDALFLTHLHGDHVNGLEMLLAWRTFVTRKPVEIYTTQTVAKDLWERRLQVSLGTMWDGTQHNPKTLSDYANLHVVEWDQPTSVGPFELRTRQTLHHLPAAALKISGATGTWAYSCDTAPDTELITWLSDADLIFHETSYGPAHTPLSFLEALPQKIRSKMFAVHLPDTLLPSEHLRFAEQGGTYRLF